MDGVIILESFEVASVWVESFSWGGAILASFILAFFGVILGVSIALIALAILEKKDGKFASNKQAMKTFWFSFATPVLIGLILGLLKGGYWLPDVTPTEYETRYKVALESNVNYKEFTDKYEIIDFENNVYTVREK